MPAPRYVHLIGGPLDGSLWDVSGLTADEQQDGAAIIADPVCAYPGGRCLYGPVEGGDPSRWYWEGDIP